MTLIALDPAATREYTLRADKDDPTVFILGTVDPYLRAAIDDGTTSFSISRGGEADEPADMVISVRRKNLELVKFGVKGWRNFKSRASGELDDVDFESQSYPVPKLGPRSGMSERCLKMLASAWIDELAIEISRDNRLSEEERRDLPLRLR